MPKTQIHYTDEKGYLMQKFAAPLSVAVALSACAVPPDTTFSDLKAALVLQQGQPIQSMVEHLGYPQNERTVIGQKIYTWERTRQITYTVPDSAYTSGTIVTRDGRIGRFSGFTDTYRSRTDQLHCKLEVFVDAADRIQNTTWNGNTGGCRYYANALPKPAAPATQPK